MFFRTSKRSLELIQRYFPMKDSSIGPPNIYLVAKVGKVQLTNYSPEVDGSPDQDEREADFINH